MSAELFAEFKTTEPMTMMSVAMFASMLVFIMASVFEIVSMVMVTVTVMTATVVTVTVMTVVMVVSVSMVVIILFSIVVDVLVLIIVPMTCVCMSSLSFHSIGGSSQGVFCTSSNTISASS